MHKTIKIRHIASLLVAFALNANCQGQHAEDLEGLFEKHIVFLASDDLEGRETGTQGEALAAEYLAQTFEAVGLVPSGNKKDYFQPFEFLLTREFSKADFLLVDDKKLDLSEGYFPLNFSGKGGAEGDLLNVGFGISAPELNYDDYQGKGETKGKIFLIEISSPDGVHPHSKYLAYHGLKARVRTAEKKGAAAVIFVNSDQQVNDPIKDYSLKVAPTDIPVLFVSTPNVLKDGQKIKLSVGLKEIRKQGKNVIGYIDHQAPHTIIIGAHYDHLGYGQNGGSLYRGVKSIHNGADDNASGTTMLIALARAFKEERFKNYNYLFIAFSGEEKGLLGSNYYV
ncbi:MAG: M28 family peptidase, partial [Cyclobacteriaceae bacterium]